MTPTSRLYDALNDFLSQCQDIWKDIRHVQTLCWMMIGMIQSQNVHLNGFRFYVHSRAPYTQSHQRRFRQWLSNRRTDILAAHHSLVSHTLSQYRWVDPHWQRGMSYLHSKYCLERFTFSAIF